jgi:hypothetical protein
MRDPHVVALYYRLATLDYQSNVYRLEPTDTSVSFENPQPCEAETDLCTFRLAEGLLTCTMKADYASPDAARKAVDPLLQAWELDDALERGRREIRFVFEKAKVIDRDPPPGGQTSNVHTMATRGTGGRFVLRAVRDAYPSPPAPERFTVSSDVDTLWHRYEGYEQGREPLLAMANACVTLLKSNCPGGKKGREGVKETYAIDTRVLREIENFAANYGDEHTARKFSGGSTRRPLTPQEVDWIDKAIRMIIRRVGEYAADPTASRSLLSMQDLPPL